ncbi:unnamed protein product [Kluyveromyces dobzhanskii CBS 2104]|uniref:WGS project CCBQ000000000 data, contig 00099 n=1 Tax=Kluyveromyces dobzhanskii CBS 2104 TaxID=1427455 RepID=A0A0A8L260_9SACH|nr:unnamed protein product [Kluyveromyces dobzhanskii CBS 2104]
MFKLQVVLVPASANRSFNLGLPPVSSESSQFILPGQQQIQQQGGNSTQLVNAVPSQNGMGTLDPNVSTNTAYLSSFMTSHITRPKLKKFLIFTKPSNTLYQLSQEILDKCNKIYPNLAMELEIDTLQDVDECDLDPDFVVKDVFNVYNTVRVILRNDVDLEANPDRQESLYSSKRRKLNNGNPMAQQGTSTGATLDQPVTVVKRRPQVLKNSALRISTPLAHQIYPPPQRDSKQVNSDYEEDEYGEDEVGDKSILPPPTVPQSPPIRISSSIGQKRLKISGSNDTVSKSETVDPSKAKQQRLPSGTPMKPMDVVETPNRPGFLAMPQQAQHLLRINSTPVVTNKRITSGMLRIPEPRISEMERTMHEGLSSPSAGLLPLKSPKIPMKKPYIADIDDSSSSEGESTGAQETTQGRVNPQIPVPVNAPNRVPSTIADDNGSPTKKSPLDATKRMNVKVAELPPQRKSSLEAKVEKLARNASELIADTHLSNNTTRKEGFSESDSEDVESENDGNDTVRIHPAERNDGSFQKSELLEVLKGSKFDIPPGFRRAGGELLDDDANKRSRRPYLTVLNKDIDNSEPDPRNIIPNKLQRQAAQKAAQFISTGTSRQPLESSSSSSSSSHSGSVSEESESDSDIEMENSDGNTDDVNFKRLNVHPLMPVVVPVVETQNVDTHDKPKSVSGTLSEETETRSEPAVDTSEAPDLKSPRKTSDQSGQKESATQSIAQINPRPISLKPVNSTRDLTPVPSQELHERIDRQLSPSPVRNKKDYVSPEFIDDSDEDVENETLNSSQQSQRNKENTDPITSKENSEQEGKSKKLTPSLLKKKQEAEQRRLLREAAKQAKQEEQERKRAEREALKKARQEEIAKKRAEREAAKKLKQEELAHKKAELMAKREVKETKKASDFPSQKANKEQPEGSSQEKQEKALNDSIVQPPDSPTKATKLDELRNKFAAGKASISGPPKKVVNKPVKLQLYSASNSNATSDSESSSDSDSSSSSSDNETSLTKKARRGIVDTPKGVFGSISKNSTAKQASEIQNVPQSTQRNDATPSKVPVTQMMEFASPSASKAPMQSALVSPPAKTTKSSRQALSRNSLSSLSDLVSRGVPEVKENTAAKSVPQPESSSSSEEESISSESDSDSDSDSDSGSDSNSSDNGSGSNFINAKSASKALGKKKTDSGFSSLIKDSKKK